MSCRALTRRDIKPIKFHGSVKDIGTMYGKTTVGLRRKIRLNGRKSKGLSRDVGYGEWENPLS